MSSSVMSFQCCALPKKQSSGYPPGMSLFLVAMLGPFADPQPFRNSFEKRGSFPQIEGESNFHSRALRIRGAIFLTDCNYWTFGRILECEFSDSCQGVHARLQITLGLTPRFHRLKDTPQPKSQALGSIPWGGLVRGGRSIPTRLI